MERGRERPRTEVLPIDAGGTKGVPSGAHPMAHGSQHTGTIMENQTRFNLTDAIEEWRRSLEETPSTMTEREEQLRLQIHQCLTAGLSEQEAFIIARRRLGQSARKSATK